MKSIPFYSELLKSGTTNEVLLYGLIEALSFSEGFCWATNETMAGRLGVSKGTVKNILSAIAKKGWVEVKVVGNKRVSIRPLLTVKMPKAPCGKKSRKCGKLVEKPVGKRLRASF